MTKTYNIQDYENLRKKIRSERELKGESKEEVILSYHEHLKNPVNEAIVTDWLLMKLKTKLDYIKIMI
ncbi:MAG: hypothetical protein AABW90_03035 [Nanoarchaeota archaeon]